MSIRAVLFAACVAGVAVAVTLGGSWSDRLSEHSGYYLVPVQDAVLPAARAGLRPRLPRRAVVAVIDGLGVEEASRMPALAALRARGQCLRTYVGSLSVSQPVYAVISTGLEQDRTGARNNEPPLYPLVAEPIWGVAREAGLSVAGISELTWWDRLFPSLPGRPAPFSPYLVRPRGEDFFAEAPAADVTLIHPIYVDETGHESGAGSAAYRKAVARADAEIAGLMAGFDFGRDLLLVTADHGHTLRGGHGGQQPRITHVLTCYAGPGVRPDAALGEMRTTSIAPSLALLLGLRFPRHMSAGASAAEDDLDVLFRIADPAAFPAAYLADRRQAVARYREENRRQLQAWPGGQTTWTGFYALHRRAQERRELLVLAVALAVLGLLGWYPARSPGAHGAAGTDDANGAHGGDGDARAATRQRLRDAALWAAWVLGIYGVIYAATLVLRGSVDATAINQRLPFVRFGFALSAAVLLAAGLLHWRLRRSVAALRADTLALLCVTLVLSLGHPAALGWHLGFPIPPSGLIYFPYFAALFGFTLSVLALPLCFLPGRPGAGPTPPARP